MLVLIFILFLHSVTEHVFGNEDVPGLWQAGACTVHLFPSLRNLSALQLNCFSWFPFLRDGEGRSVASNSQSSSWILCF